MNRIKPKMVKPKGDMMDISDIMDILATYLIGVVPEDEYIVISTNRASSAALAANNSKAGQAFEILPSV